jgi:probable HAF family extracellular repeat protein
MESRTSGGIDRADRRMRIPQRMGLATGINSSGEIVGFGTINNQTHKFLLTPVQER